MSLPNAKELAKLAAACRKAGIISFKCGDMEFTLSETAPSTSKKASAKVAKDVQDTVESDELPYEQLLHWSVSDMVKEDPKGDQ